MSYKSIQTNDLMKKYIHDMTNFLCVLPHLEKAKTFETWEIWLEKLSLIDKRSLKRYLCANKSKFPAEWLCAAQKIIGPLPELRQIHMLNPKAENVTGSASGAHTRPGKE